MNTKMTLAMRLPIALTLIVIGWVAAAGNAVAQTNPIQIENAKAGSTDWLLTTVVRHDDEIYELGWQRRRGIEAYASHTSIKAGERLDVHVSTYPVNQYSVSVYRMGYYGGAGAARARQRETDPHDVIVEQAGIETYFRPVG